MTAWLRLHAMAFAGTLAKLAATPFATLLNALVIGVALALPAGAYVLLVNLQTAARGVSSDPEFSVFMALDAQKADVADIDKRLRALPDVARVEFRSREAALAEFRRHPSMGDVIAALDRNPLPDAFIVRVARNDGEVLDALAARVRGWPNVEHVQVDSAWVRRVAAAIGVGRASVLILAALLSFALLAVTFNTIRLQMLTQRDEIELAKLLGATNGTIRRPFYYYGALLGLLGGGAALAIVHGALHVLNRSVADLARQYGSDFRLDSLPPQDLASLLAFAALLGLCGAWLSVTRHLREFEPR
ncbi:MAG: FtsX-like permease family protein [Burkholderiales bacterium]|nr:FtsX-like permease family protein [Burkholderiales bacterium]